MFDLFFVFDFINLFLTILVFHLKIYNINIPSSLPLSLSLPPLSQIREEVKARVHRARKGETVLVKSHHPWGQLKENKGLFFSFFLTLDIKDAINLLEIKKPLKKNH